MRKLHPSPIEAGAVPLKPPWNDGPPPAGHIKGPACNYGLRNSMCRADDLRLPLSAYAENGDPPRKARRDLVTALTNHLSHERGKSWKELKNALENLSRSELKELVILLVGRMSHFLGGSPEPMERTGFPRLEE